MGAWMLFLFLWWGGGSSFLEDEHAAWLLSSYIGFLDTLQCYGGIMMAVFFPGRVLVWLSKLWVHYIYPVFEIPWVLGCTWVLMWAQVGPKAKLVYHWKLEKTPLEMLVNTAGLVHTSFPGIKTRQIMFFPGMLKARWPVGLEMSIDIDW